MRLKSFKELCEELEQDIESTYTDGVDLEHAEDLAAKFLHAQLIVSAELKKADLDSRMRKSGLKAIRATIYTDACKGQERKPTEAALAAIIDTHELVGMEQNKLDQAEVNRDDLERYYNIFGNAHIYYRGVAKGSFGG